MAYDFKELNDKEFEVLVCDLLSRHFSARVERFRVGKDKGVDGRFFATPGRETVVQCKHWARSGVSALIKYLEEVEQPKLNRLNPARYVLVTSLELSRHNKEQIAKIFAPWLKSPADVYGNEDLNDMLAKAPEIERRHYKLWLSSTGVLNTLLNAAILGRSDFTLQELKQQATQYVTTQHHASAQDKLEQLRVLLITGEPGIGKTTLAGQLCLHYVLEHNFQLCVLANSIEEAENIFKPREKQIFYFDDFLGRNYLEALDRHEDSHIVGFIKRTAQDATKRFVLTSRTTILNQGKDLTDLFHIHNIERSEYEIRVDSLTELDRARILYNHIWFSNLKQTYIEQILAEKRYRHIIKHKNFNPRLIAFITDSQKLTAIPTAQYWGYIDKTLTNPAEIWEHQYNSQLDDYGRTLLLLVVYSATFISEEDLRNVYERFLQLPVARGYKGVVDFTSTTARLVGAVLNRTLHKQGAAYSLFNPSVADYVLWRTAKNPTLLTAVLFSLRTDTALMNLGTLVENKLVSGDHAATIVTSLIADSFSDAFAAEDLDYCATLADLAMRYGHDDAKTAESVATFVNSVDLQNKAILHWDRLASAAQTCLKAGRTTAENALRLIRASAASGLDHDDLLALANIRIHLYGEERDEAEKILRPLIIDYWKGNIEDEVRSNGILDDLYSDEESLEGEQLVEEMVEDVLNEYSIEFDYDDIQTICSQVDIVSEIEGNRERTGGDDSYEGRSDLDLTPPVDAIDDLFDTDGPMAGKHE